FAVGFTQSMRSSPDPSRERRLNRGFAALRGLLVAVLVAFLPGCQPTKKATGQRPSSPGAPAASVTDLLAAGERWLEAGENQRAWEAYQRARSQAEKAGDRAATIASLLG